jgi:AmmeMemoRadiSam system protein A
MPLSGLRTAADVLIEVAPRRVVLVLRRNPPAGWAIPGGFVEVGEPVEIAATREAFEETGLEVELSELFHVYSDPERDPRFHTISVVFIGRASGEPSAGDDAAQAGVFGEDDLPTNLAFDHGLILADYFHYRRTGVRPPPRPRHRHQLNPEDRRQLLLIARQAIQETSAPDPPTRPGQLSERLFESAGVFVSLHRGGDLRGCIGTFARDRPLHQAVRDMAAAAAFEDPRFPPVGTDEVDSIEIEISLLSSLRRTEPQFVMPGLHGVSIVLGERKGVFLPQVASEAGWDRATLLEQTCLKAGLPANAWSDPAAEVSVFTAEVFGDAQSGQSRGDGSLQRSKP